MVCRSGLPVPPVLPVVPVSPALPALAVLELPQVIPDSATCPVLQVLARLAGVQTIPEAFVNSTSRLASRPCFTHSPLLLTLFHRLGSLSLRAPAANLTSAPCSPSRPRRLARPRTPPFHGDNTGSNPVGDANKTKDLENRDLNSTQTSIACEGAASNLSAHLRMLCRIL